MNGSWLMLVLGVFALAPRPTAADKSEFWSFQPPTRPNPPSVQNESWIRNPIDRFILAKLEQEGLQPSPEADRNALLRRLHLDLTGLPPTPEQLAAFQNDPSGDAYDKQIEALLQSPHYGERWARHWLDAARYADSDGFEKDKQRRVWFYRDWVIRAFNEDMPYDEFIIEQIAGDLLPNATQAQKVATGFLRNSMINEEGGVDPEQFRMEAMFDRMDAIGKSVLGLTIQCAQCHDHKYDPISQEEYYRMFAFINDTHEANITVYTPEEQMTRARVFESIRAVEERLRHEQPDWKERMRAWEESIRDRQTEWTVLFPDVEEISTGGQKYLPQGDGSFLAQGYAPTKHRVKLIAKTVLKDIQSFRLELLTDPNLPRRGPGRSIYGTAALTEFEASHAPASDTNKTTRVEWIAAEADLNLEERELKPVYDDKSNKRRVTGPIDYAIDGKDETAWGTDAGPGRRNRPRNAVFQAKESISHEDGTVLYIYLSQKHGGWNSDDNQNHNLGRFRLSIRSQPIAQTDPLPPNIATILDIPESQRSENQRRELFSYWRTTVPEWKEANQRIERLWKEHPEGTTQLVLEERENPRGTHLLKRGDFLNPGREVKAGAPSVLHPLPEDAPMNRLTFAKWLADPKSPTTARAIVNRVWQAYFGIGLVETPEDLGTQSQPPSHPDLLDWLACEFMDNGWSFKSLHRLIVDSAAYRQSSRTTGELNQRDPYNRLLARGPRFRVEAEIVRDIALAAGGLLNPEVGGPSVYPPAPDFLFQPPASYGPKIWNEEQDDDRYRRALYTFRYRSVPYPAMEVFDAPNGDFSCVKRARSNTPLQALTTLNEPLFVECARAMARRVLNEGGTDTLERLRYACQVCLSRNPTVQEARVLTDFLNRQKEHIAAGWTDAGDIIGESHPASNNLPPESTPTQLAAWTALSRVLLNLDETITKE